MAIFVTHTQFLGNKWLEVYTLQLKITKLL